MITTETNPPSSEILMGRWELDPRRSKVGFRVRPIRGLVTVTGHFDQLSGRLEMSGTPAIKLSVNAASVQTGNRRRDQHLRSSDFFDVENHPEVRFVSESVVMEIEALKVSGRLSVRGRSIPVNVDAQTCHVDGGLEVRAATTVPHRELGMTWSPFGLIPPRSELFLDVHLIPVRNTTRIPVMVSAS